MAYASLSDFKLWTNITDAVDDTLIAELLNDASADIEADCHRSFSVGTAGVVRYFTALDASELLIDDCSAVTAVATDTDGDRTYEDTWAATDYDLLPENAAAQSRPYTLLAVAPSGDYSFPVGVRKGVKLTGTWGWPAVPSKIKRACVLRAAWLYARKGAPLGVAGSSEMGILRVGRWDSDYEKLIAEYRDPGVA